MRVAIDYRPALLNREGIGRYVRELVRALVELGHGEELGLFGATLASSEIPRAELGLGRARLFRVRFPSRWMPRAMGLFSRGLEDFVGGAELVHHSYTHVLPVRRAAEVATLFDCIWARPQSRHLSAAASESMTRAARELASRSQRILVPTEWVARDIAATLGVARERILVTPLGCDHVLSGLALRPRRDAAGATPFVLTVSRVDPRKNHLGMLRAFERLVREGFPHRWIVAGPRGWRAEEFEAALERSPARERVEWRRFVGEDELVELYQGAELFLFASHSEGFGLPPLEAMALGTPVVASNATCLPEVCGDAALLPDPDSVDQLFEACRRLLADRELAANLVARGRRRAAEFTWRRSAESTWSAYRACLEPPLPSRP